MKSTEVYKTIKEWAEYFKNIIKRIVGILEQKSERLGKKVSCNNNSHH